MMTTASPNWIDLSAHGLRLYMMEVGAEKKRFFAVIGDYESNAAALAQLGFTRHPKFGYHVRGYTPDNPLRMGDIRRAFPQHQVVHADPATFFLRVGVPAVEVREVATPLPMAATERQGTTEGLLLADMIEGWGQHAVASAREPFSGWLAVPAVPPVAVRGERTTEGLYVVTLQEQHAKPVQVALDDAGQWHYAHGSGDVLDHLWLRHLALRHASERWSDQSPQSVPTAQVGIEPRTLRFRGGELATLVDMHEVGDQRFMDVAFTVGDASRVLCGLRVPKGLGPGDFNDLVLRIARGAGDRWQEGAPSAGLEQDGDVGAAMAATSNEGAEHEHRDSEPDRGPIATESGSARRADELASADGTDLRAASEADGRRAGAAEVVAGRPAAQDASEGRGARAGDGVRAAVGADPGDGGGERRSAAELALAAELAEAKARDRRSKSYRLERTEGFDRAHFNERQAVANNLAAIRALRRGQDDPASVTDEERDVLIRFSGWGGLPGVFSPGHHLSRGVGEALRELLSEGEYAAARASTVNAHFTSLTVIDKVWEGVRRMGFTGGTVVEPGAGIGLFLARVPADLRLSTDFVAVEKEPISAAMMQLLFRGDRIIAGGYEDAPIADDSVAMVVGNVPFGDFRVNDPRYRRLGAPIHDYFIVKSLDKLAPGGIAVLITSSYTLDKASSQYRDAMYETSDLIAAIRLPDDAFAGNAGTEVVTDLLVFRKRLPGESAASFDWQQRAEVVGADRKMHLINGIFNTPRGFIAGELQMGQSMYSGKLQTTVSRRDPETRRARPLDEYLDEAIARLPQGVWAPQVRGDLSSVAAPSERAERDGSAAEGALCLVDDKVGQIIEGKPTPLKLKALDAQRIRGFIGLRDQANALLQAMLGNCSDQVLADGQKALHEVYDAFVERFGPVNGIGNCRAYRSDPDVDLVLSLENYDAESKTATKSAVFFERTVGAAAPVDRCETTTDALAVCLSEYGRVVPFRIGALTGRSWVDCERELAGTAIFRDPESGGWEISARYLSGHIGRKLALAEEAAKEDASFEINVQALRERMPRQLTAEEIDISLGSPLLSTGDVVEFVRHLYQQPRMEVDISHNPIMASWTLEVSKHHVAPQYSTPRFSAGELVELSLQGKSPRVVDYHDEGDRKVGVFNEVQTALAIERQKDIQRAFKTWVWTDTARTDRIVMEYNVRFNQTRSADYRGLSMTVPGMTPTRRLRGHQDTGVARIVMEQNTLLSHPVGFGKTATLAAAAMKLRSLGLARKVMGVVPKNVIYQFGGEIKQWFPTARTLIIRAEDLNPKGRKAFLRKIQTSAADVILTTPEAFKRIKLPGAAEVAFLNEEISRYEAALEHEKATRGSQGKTREVKQIEKAKLRLTARLEALLNNEGKDDNGITLDDLGINALMVDEAHRYKSLQVITRERVLGVPSSASQRAADMCAKVRHVQRQGGKVVFATGSAITNTMAEAYNLQRFLQNDELEATQISAFDAWKATFGELVCSLEPDPAGTGYRQVSRLAEVKNVPELVRMLSLVTDAVADDDKFVAARPKATFSTIISEPTPLQQLFREALAERVRMMRESPEKAKDRGENILVALGDAKRASLDLRTLFPRVPGALAGGKIGKVVEKVHEIYEKHADTRAAQAIFLDLGTPPAKGAKRKVVNALNAYADIKGALIERGVPEQAIAFIHDANSDAAKAEMFRRVRAGEIRVILGSTEKMGEGSNLQERLVALHHMNAPHHPGHVTQRNGRIIRQGNLFKEVEVYTYVTKGLLEDWAWHLVTLKAGFIDQVMRGMAAHTDGEGLARRIVEDAATMDFGAIEAAASDNPLVKEKAQADAKVKQLTMLRDAHAQARGRLREMLDGVKFSGQRDRELLARYELASNTLAEWRSNKAAHVEAARKLCVAPAEDVADLLGGKKQKKPAKSGDLVPVEQQFLMTVEGTVHLDKDKAAEALLAAVKAASTRVYARETVVGELEGLEVVARILPSGSQVISLRVPASDRLLLECDVSAHPQGLLRRVQNLVESIEGKIAKSREFIEQGESRRAQYEAELAREWPHQEELAAALKQQGELNLQLAEMNAERADRKDALAVLADALRGYGEDASVRALMDDDDAYGDMSAATESEDGDDDSDEDEDLGDVREASNEEEHERPFAHAASRAVALAARR